MPETTTGLTYEVVTKRSSYATRYATITADRQPTREETTEIANAIDGGHLFGSRCDVLGSGRYDIAMYVD